MKGNLLAPVVEPLIEQIIPCIIVTPLDCFWDGAKALGPSTPIVIE
jgi:patched 1 protein